MGTITSAHILYGHDLGYEPPESLSEDDPWEEEEERLKDLPGVSLEYLGACEGDSRWVLYISESEIVQYLGDECKVFHESMIHISTASWDNSLQEAVRLLDVKTKGDLGSWMLVADRC